MQGRQEEIAQLKCCGGRPPVEKVSEIFSVLNPPDILSAMR